MNEPDRDDLPPDRNSLGGNLGRVTGRFFWLLVPVVVIALLLWAIR